MWVSVSWLYWRPSVLDNEKINRNGGERRIYAGVFLNVHERIRHIMLGLWIGFLCQLLSNPWKNHNPLLFIKKPHTKCSCKKHTQNKSAPGGEILCSFRSLSPDSDTTQRQSIAIPMNGIGFKVLYNKLSFNDPVLMNCILCIIIILRYFFHIYLCWRLLWKCLYSN